MFESVLISVVLLSHSRLSVTFLQAQGISVAANP